MLTALLGPWRFLLYAAVVSAFIGGLAYAKGQYDEKQQAIGAAPYILAIEKQKQEAAILLQAETERANKITQTSLDDARKSEDDYQKKIAAIRVAVNVAGGMRLSDPGRRESGNCPAAGSNGAGTPESGASASRLSGEASAFLLDQAKLADEVATWAQSCHAFVNRPTVRDQVNKLRGTQ